MRKFLWFLAYVSFVGVIPLLAEDAKAISADSGPLGDLLRQWAKEGTAAGNAGDFYDNRDGGHSGLDLTPYPQLGRIDYSDDEKKRNIHWALTLGTRPGVVFGNSSTSAPAGSGGSNPRQAYCTSGGLEKLARQYRANNLYIYPEHQDNHPPMHGEGGQGDLFPANSPYLIVSQGSSGSDQPFMRAVPSTLAAFRPEVKAKLVEKGLVMPALQMILRMTSKAVQSPADYLTGRAHPVVFQGANVDALKMAELAHAITLEDIPPMVQIRLIEADEARPGVDFFDLQTSEDLAQTESAIARIYRSMAPSRRLVVSAEDSFDVNGRPLQFHWVLLHGDPHFITITPRNDTKSIGEITIRYHDRAPSGPGEEIESNRIDIGVFVHNGAYYSAPAFVTSFSLANEGRTYGSDGHLLEVGYGMGTPLFRIADWVAFFGTLTAQTPASAILRAQFAPGQIDSIEALSGEYDAAVTRANELDRKKKDLEEAARAADADAKPASEAAAKAARDDSAKAAAERDSILDRKPGEISEPLKWHVPALLAQLAADPAFYVKHREEFGALTASAEAARKRVEGLGIATNDGDGFHLRPIIPGSGSSAERLSRYERVEISRFHGELLASLLPGVQFEHRRYLVDFRLTAPKAWRDVYAYDARGNSAGWTRYTERGAKVQFNPDGTMIFSKHPPLSAAVSYWLPPEAAKRPPWEWPPLSFSPILQPIEERGNSLD